MRSLPGATSRGIGGDQEHLVAERPQLEEALEDGPAADLEQRLGHPAQPAGPTPGDDRQRQPEGRRTGEHLVGLDVGPQAEGLCADLPKPVLGVEGPGAAVVLPHREPQPRLPAGTGLGQHRGHQGGRGAAALPGGVDVEAADLQRPTVVDEVRPARERAGRFQEKHGRGAVGEDRPHRLGREVLPEVAGHVRRGVLRRERLLEEPCSQRGERRRLGHPRAANHPVQVSPPADALQPPELDPGGHQLDLPAVLLHLGALRAEMGELLRAQGGDLEACRRRGPGLPPSRWVRRSRSP